jgi:8-oxo-dGTP pyrophosphatase MutT (NUDIX family)
VTVLRQSGAIIVRLDTREPQVLLVTGRRDPRKWIFPKGHIEKGETPAAAALREAKEEAGVVATLIGPVGVLEFRFFGVRSRVEYFLALLSREAGPPEDGRSRAWCSLSQALDQLRHKNTRKLLRKAWKQLG